MGIHRRADKDNLKKAIFLDRDGTLIRYQNDIVRFSQLKIIKGVPEALIILKKLGFLLILVTNQSVIGRGHISSVEVDALHEKFNKKILTPKAALDFFYVCPHREYDHCMCRKPKIGFIKAAAREHHIDLKNSFFVGDCMRDVATGKNAKIKTILVKTGKAGNDRDRFKARPDYEVKNLLAAAKLIRRKYLLRT